MKSPTRADPQQIDHIAREQFGYDDLRPGQREVIASVLEGRDTLAVMPTGWGKSALYQIAGAMLAGPTVVVSPLIALQRDQVDSLAEQEVGGAAQVNSTIGAAQQRETIEQLEGGDLEFLFLAPEQFNSEETLDRLRSVSPSLFVIDEAHCISEWGHSFRPDYLRLGTVIEALGMPRILALTATAAPPVREEIVSRLRMKDPRVIVRGFDRPNLRLGASTFADEETKMRALLEAVEGVEKPGIVYAATRRHAEEAADALRERGIRTVLYHAGLKASEREEAQSRFMADETEVIVATKAFGMGIDKPNVRFVFHADISDSLDSYYQEIGRAGRDGDEAQARLFYSPQDLRIHQFFAGSGKVDVEQVERVAEAIQGHDEPTTPQELAEETGLSQAKLNTALNRLEEVGVVEALPSGELLPADDAPDTSEAAEEAVQAQERRREFQRSRLEMMRAYAERRDCRREFILNYFGEEFQAPCGFCDNCMMGAMPHAEEADVPFPIGSRVTHPTWNEGQVLRYEGNKVIVLFNEVGYKTLSIEIVMEQGLLQPAA